MLVAFDLDDTLFPEMEYVRSAYRAIARRYGSGLLPAMMSAATPAEAFDSTGLPIEELLAVYRGHFPDIRLPWDSLYLLASLRNAGHSLAVVTDGRSLTQRNKFDALGLGRFVDPSLGLMISEEVGESKTGGRAFRLLEERYGRQCARIYVGDNPAKDFRTPAMMGWTTVCLLDRGENIHIQDFSGLDAYDLPDRKIHSLYELSDLTSLSAH
ncbi:MAG: HAD family hydrolase [Duncaniella sp.]|nr:HAD family hydrolase [Duncaniella sp.]